MDFPETSYLTLSTHGLQTYLLLLVDGTDKLSWYASKDLQLYTM